VDLVQISRELARRVDRLKFGAPVSHVYNPLAYAREPHEQYLEKYGGGSGRVVLLGMNPGPFGMAQTGVPFGDVRLVRDWLGVQGHVGRPKHEHPKRPVLGFACERSEVSGTRLWGWARDRFGKPEQFFAHFFVVNYCPLVFMEESCRNVTPDKLPAREREALFLACDEALRRIVEELEPSWLIGVGGFAESRAKAALGERVKIGCILHPSPASPAANAGWAEGVDRRLGEYGIPVAGAR
jgi:single-strand selective monofunctional uracil DNA glycosylase